MNDIELIKEKNRKYLKKKQSLSYKLFESFFMLLKTVLKGDIAEFKSTVRKKKNNLQIRFHTTGKTRLPQKKNTYRNEKIAVYTVFFGNIDTLLEPLVIDDNCDYFVITDQEIHEDSIWKKIDVDNALMSEFSNRKKNRYYKMHSHELFSDYAYCVYLDANIYIYGLISDLVYFINPKTGIGVHNMPNRGNIYEEIYARSLIDPRDSDLLEKQRKDYQQKGFANDEGMFECNVLVMSNTDKCVEVMERWWTEYEKYPARDQVSFPYVLWELGISQDDIGIIGNCMRLNPCFRIKEHIIQ